MAALLIYETSTVLIIIIIIIVVVVVVIISMDIDSLPLDHVDILLKNLPNDDEKSKFENYIKDKKDPDLLPPADRFLFDVSKQ